ncbi:MAG: hypothetical protein J2P52_01750, partial [Blastocatellia bacterium]|nr:hypothetical protein [Blastocatellia bacterium]
QQNSGEARDEYDRHSIHFGRRSIRNPGAWKGQTRRGSGTWGGPWYGRRASGVVITDGNAGGHK